MKIPNSRLDNSNYTGSKLHEHSNGLRNHLSKIKPLTARNFLFRQGYKNSSFVLPEFFVPAGLENIQLEPISWPKSGVSKVLATASIDIVAPKGSIGWRRFSFVHPYSYWHIVNTLTEEESWEQIRTSLSRKTAVASYTIPTFANAKTTIQGASIDSWLSFAERDLLSDSGQYSHLAVTDIQNFYSSIYTHSLAWSINGKENIKAHRRDYKNLIGNRIDKLFQSAHDNQTNGIPVGTLISDVISELLLKDVDSKISESLKSKDVIIARYRDDYRILSKSYQVAKEVLDLISKTLRDEYDLHLNSEKTRIDSDIIGSALRPWARASDNSALLRDVLRMDSEMSGKDLKKALIEIYHLQTTFGTSRVSLTLLYKINKLLSRAPIDLSNEVSNLYSCIGVLEKLIEKHEQAIPQVMLLVDKMLAKVTDKISKDIVEDLWKLSTRTGQNDYLELWVYRLAIHRFNDLSTDILNNPQNKLLTMLKSDRPAIYQFPNADKLPKLILKELEKFCLIDKKILKRSVNMPISDEILDPFRNQYM